MIIEDILKSKPYNELYLNRYIKFISYCKDKNLNFVRKGKNMKNGIYMETHHICPQSKDLFPEYGCLKDNKWNEIDLTARQHFIAHMILWKAYPNSRMVYAFFCMNNRISNNQERYVRITSAMYEKLKEEKRFKAKEYKHSEEVKRKIGAASKNFIRTEEWCKNISLSKKGERNPNFNPNKVIKEPKTSKEERLKIKLENERKQEEVNKRNAIRIERSGSIRATRLDQTQSEETKRKISEGVKRNWELRKYKMS